MAQQVNEPLSDEAVSEAKHVWKEVRPHYNPQKFGPVYKVTALGYGSSKKEFEFKIGMVGTTRYMVLWNGIVIEGGNLKDVRQW